MGKNVNANSAKVPRTSNPVQFFIFPFLLSVEPTSPAYDEVEQYPNGKNEHYD